MKIQAWLPLLREAARCRLRWSVFLLSCYICTGSVWGETNNFSVTRQWQPALPGPLV